MSVPAPDSLILGFRGEALRIFLVEEWPLLVGKAPDCDIVVPDRRLRDHHYRVSRVDGDLHIEALVRPNGAHRPQESPPSRRIDIEEEIPLTDSFSLRRVRTNEEQRAASPITQSLAGSRRANQEPLALLVPRRGDVRRTPLDKALLWVGRARDNDLVIDDPTVSRHHGLIEQTRLGWTIRDLGSRNGTTLNGHGVSRGTIRPGMRIGLGQAALQVVSEGAESFRKSGLVATSPRMRDILAEVERYAQLPWPVLIHGESGTGKEGIARALHERGPRRTRPFVAVNAGGLTASLIESELFGHKKGAFTGAAADRKGLFELADGGTLFLDEIGELPLSLQAQLLRVVETWQVRPVGDEQWRPIDVRLVCATHQDLLTRVGQGQFRSDLYYRLARLLVELPPLRLRTDEIEPLAQYLLGTMESDIGPRRLSPAGLRRLMRYPWPGNVRELRNVLGAAAACSDGAVISAATIRRTIERLATRCQTPTLNEDALMSALSDHGGNLSATARSLGLARSTLRDRIKGVHRVQPPAPFQKLRAPG